MVCDVYLQFLNLFADNVFKMRKQLRGGLLT